ncbi:MAG: diaminopimelate epimerase [Chitinophagales bacterium]|nr:diaminopimelate epimerase [Chitinophagales bacterium]
MTVKFHKYQGTGNDFVMIDNRGGSLTRQHTELVKKLCDRRFGIGADGLILLQDVSGYDFEMVYFNSDGNESTMCGNGGRCLIKFANHLGVILDTCRFLAIDGPHDGEVLPDGTVSLKMKDVEEIENIHNDFVLNTGSPHYVSFVNGVQQLDVFNEARKIRYSPRFEKEGINVNFVEKLSDREIFVRTYERGVEAETLSCGTGVVASSLAFAATNGQLLKHVYVNTPGGNLEVTFENNGRSYKNIYLKGPAERVFEGELEV